MQPQTLDPSAAVGLYVKLGGGEWLYRGCVHNGHPTEVMPLQVGGGGRRRRGVVCSTLCSHQLFNTFPSLQWPVSEQGFLTPTPGAVQIGVSIEPGSEIIHKEGSKLGAREDFAKRVGMDLFRCGY